MSSVMTLSQLTEEFLANAAQNKLEAIGGPCDNWKRLRPTVDSIIGILKGLGTLFPKAKLAAQTLETLEGLLDSLCPSSLGGDLGVQSESTSDLSNQLQQALHPTAAVPVELPCAAWNRVRPVVLKVIGVLQGLAAEVPVFAQVAAVLETLTQLADGLCGTTGLVDATDAGNAAAAGSGSQILIWEDDPFLTAVGTGTPVAAQAIADDIPNNTQALLKTQITGAHPPVGKYSTKTPEFRFWNAQATLARTINFWGQVLPAGTQWSADTSPLSVGLDVGRDFNAFYSRDGGLNFFHGVVNRVSPPITVFSGESPHIVSHETGHAILDALKPELFQTMSSEVAAFHESFADVSSILTALQLKSLRDQVLHQTGGRLNSNSRLSQLARQLGWAIRVQVSASSVDVDSLRNAANRFFYRNPSTLPPNAPASSLSSEVHSFSRVFTGAFLDVLAGMFQIGPATGQPTTGDSLKAIARDAGRLLVEGIRLAAVVPGFYGQVAAGMIQADAVLNRGRYRSALTSAFIRRGILGAATAVALVRELQGAKESVAFGVTGFTESRETLTIENDNEGYRQSGRSAPNLQLSPITTKFGLTIYGSLPAESKRFPTASATLVAGGEQTRSPEEEAQEFLEDLIQAGHVSHDRISSNRSLVQASMVAFASPETGINKTHYLIEEGDKLILRRHHFDCRLCGGVQ